MSFAISYDVMCDCSGCPGCPEPTPRSAPIGCGFVEPLGLVDTKTEAIRLTRKEGWSFSRRDGRDHARCPDCKRRQEYET